MSRFYGSLCRIPALLVTELGVSSIAADSLSSVLTAITNWATVRLS